MGARDLPDDEEPEAEAAPPLRVRDGALERVEEIRDLLRADGLTVVQDRDLGDAAARAHRDGGASAASRVWRNRVEVSRWVG
jgi:hypothetical protein